MRSIPRRIQISSSIGITLYPQDGEEADILIKKAEATLDLIQQQGTNHYQFYNVGLVEATSQLAEIESLLQQAMVRLDPSQDSPQDSSQDSLQDSPLNP